MSDEPGYCAHHTDVRKAAERFERLELDIARNLKLIATQCPTCRRTP